MLSQCPPSTTAAEGACVCVCVSLSLSLSLSEGLQIASSHPGRHRGRGGSDIQFSERDGGGLVVVLEYTQMK